MPVSTEVQQKVVQLTSNNMIDIKTKLAVRKKFYELKQNEVDLEAAANEFDETVKVYESQIDKILKDTGSVAQTVEPEVKEEIITPTANTGIKVRMQEEFDDQAEDVTQEVPYEVKD